MLELTQQEWSAIALSLKVAFCSVWISFPLALFFSWLLARRQFIGKSFLDGIIHLPLVVPPVVIGYLLLMVLGKGGVLGSWLYETFGLTLSFKWEGAAVASAVMGFPLMVRSIRLSLENVDQRLELAARTLRAGPTRVFTTITLPLIAPGIATGIILAFARSLGEFGATITFVSNIPGETQTLPLALYTATQTPGTEEAAFRLVVISIILAIFAMALSEILARKTYKKIKGL